jgi:peptide chain release factor 1
LTIPAERLDQIAHRFAELEARLASGTLEGAEFVAASRDYAELEPGVRVAEQVRAMRGELAELEARGAPATEIAAKAGQLRRLTEVRAQVLARNADITTAR